MNHRLRRAVVFALLSLGGPAWLLGCHESQVGLAASGSLETTISPAVRVPHRLHRLMVLYPLSDSADLTPLYHRLDGATFQLTTLRSDLHIVDRLYLHVLTNEQHLQAAGPVAEETAVRVGRVLGADSVLLYEVVLPSLREQVFSTFLPACAPVAVVSKILVVESAEVVFHNVVTVPVVCDHDPWASFGSETQLLPVVRIAAERGVAQTIVDLYRAFR